MTTAPHPTAPSAGPLTAFDAEEAVRLAVAALAAAGDGANWRAPAGDLRWDCWETVEHLADSLLYYAGQIATAEPPQADPVPFVWRAQREGGPVNMVFARRDAGPAGLVQVLATCSALLASVLRGAPADGRAHHVHGLADAEGFAAMAVVETLVHLHDVAQGLGLPWQPPDTLCARVLDRLFPHVEQDTAGPWPTLLWATGRAALGGRPRLTE